MNEEQIRAIVKSELKGIFLDIIKQHQHNGVDSPQVNYQDLFIEKETSIIPDLNAITDWDIVYPDGNDRQLIIDAVDTIKTILKNKNLLK